MGLVNADALEISNSIMMVAEESAVIISSLLLSKLR